MSEIINKQLITLKSDIEIIIHLPRPMDGYTTVGKIETDFKEEVEIIIAGICELDEDLKVVKKYPTNVVVDSSLIGFSLYDKEVKNRYRYISLISDADIEFMLSLVEDET